MRKERRNRLLAGLVAVAVVGWLAWLIFRTHEPPEPVYQGKRLSERLDEGLPDEQFVMLQQIGTNAIPTLLRMLRAHDSSLKLKLIALAQKQHFINFNFVPAERRNELAAMAFQILGPIYADAVPALLQIYRENISESSRSCAAVALGRMGPAAIPAVPLLLSALADTNADRHLRANAAQALGEIQARPELVVPALIKCLKDAEPDVRSNAAFALAWFGTNAIVAVPALIDLLKDPDTDAKTRAEQALKAIDPEAAAKAGVK